MKLSHTRHINQLDNIVKVQKLVRNISLSGVAGKMPLYTEIYGFPSFASGELITPPIHRLSSYDQS